MLVDGIASYREPKPYSYCLFDPDVRSTIA
jgi:hypothetical protein